MGFGTWEFEVNFEPFQEPARPSIRWAIVHGVEVRFGDSSLVFSGPASTITKWMDKYYDTGETTEEKLEYYRKGTSWDQDEIICLFDVNFNPEAEPGDECIVWALRQGMAVQYVFGNDYDGLRITGPKEDVVEWIKKFYDTGETPEEIIGYTQE